MYSQRYAEAFAAPIGANGLLSGFVRNPAVTGSYAEAWVRTLVETMVTGLQVATGAVLRTSDVVKNRNLRSVAQRAAVLKLAGALLGRARLMTPKRPKSAGRPVAMYWLVEPSDVSARPDR